MPQRRERSAVTLHDAPLLVAVRLLATWLFAGTILGVVLGFWIGIALGLIIAVVYVRAVHSNAVLAALQPRSVRRTARRASSILRTVESRRICRGGPYSP
jgi:hypothetical protein